MKYSKEIIYHFTCEKCQRWWSIALENELTNKEGSWTCPWCSHTHDKETDTTKYKNGTIEAYNLILKKFTNKHEDAS